MKGVWDKLSERDALRVKGIVDRMVDGEAVIDNAAGAYKPLRVEEYMQIDEFAGWKNLRVIIFGHYGKQNGDVMRDPEVMFLYKDDGIYPLVVPYYFRNDYVGKEDEAIDFSAKTINQQMQRSIKSFFVTFLDNIYQQQGLTAAEPSAALKAVRKERKEGKKMVDRVVVLNRVFQKYPHLKPVYEHVSNNAGVYEQENLISFLDKGEDAFAKELERIQALLNNDSSKEKPASILNQENDLLGNKKQIWFYPLNELKKEYAKISVGQPDSWYDWKSRDMIKSHIQSTFNNYLDAIEGGYMTANDAKAIIESADLEVPARIIAMAKKETSQPISKEAQDIIRPEWDKMQKFIEETDKKIKDAKMEDTIEQQDDTAASAEAAAATPSPTDWLTGDNYFEHNPENVLGVPFEASGRFGKVTKYKGTIEDVTRIEAETNFLKPYNFDTNPLISETKATPQEKILKPVAQNNVKRALKQSKEDVNKKLVRSNKSIHIEPTGADLQSIYDIYNKYNPEISDEELYAFIWYRDSIGQRLSQHWYDVAFSKGADIDYMYSEQTLKKWVNDGVLCYYSGSQVLKGSANLIPAYLYLSENIWHKQAWIKKDEEAIIAQYGQPAFDLQNEKLNAAFKVKYDQRLTLKGSGMDDGLVLLPVSEFAGKFMIKTLQDEEPFVLKAINAAGKRFGKPDFYHPNFLDKKQYGREKATEFEALSLTDAFCTWLIKDKTINFKRGTHAREIIDYYIFSKQIRYESLPDDKLGRQREKANHERIKARAKEEADKLFLDFLNSHITLNDRIRLETEWNGTFNSYVPINFNKVPVLFACAKWWEGTELEILAEKREAAAFVFSEGAGCLAYGTGIGKTFSSIFTVAQFMYAGYAQKPLFVVPNSVYKQFMNELKGLLPQFKIFGLYNLSKQYLAQLLDENGKVQPMPANSIAIMTYEGFENIGFNETSGNMLLSELYDILNQESGGEETTKKKSERQIAGFMAKLENIVGRGLRGTLINVEDLGFDYFTFDEAHKMKKVFTQVKGNVKKDEDGEDEKGKEKNRYKIQSGVPSTIALKGFMLSYYIQQNNNWRNVCLLTATPFTNSPLEIFSVLSFVAYRKLKEMDMNSLQNFFDTYIDVTTELVITAKLQPERKQVIKGFNNLVALQQLVRRFINYKGEDEVMTKKPNKIVLPLKYKKVDDTVVRLSESEQVETNLPLTFEQQTVMDQIKMYVEGKINFDEFDLSVFDEDIELDDEGEEANEGNRTAGIVMDYEDLDEDEKMGVRILRGMNLARNLALSPYLLGGGSGAKCKIPQTLTHKKYIETSPKLMYTMECVRSVKEWHEQSGTPVSGQVIYMDRGICYFGLIREYLIKEVGYKPHEIELVYSGLPKDGFKSKSAIQDRFLGVRFNDETQEMEELPDNERVKVLIGSSTIREGMNLQRHSSVLYNDFVDWNPTDSIQLDGRIHRQKNLFNNVRIVIPLMIDSMDIFIFQKLEEKTSRINTIWATDGKMNVLKLEDFNPREMKSALIKDETVLAKMQIEEYTEKLEDEKGSLASEIKRIENIQAYMKDLDDHMEDAEELLAKYRDVKPAEPNTPIWERAKYFTGRIQDLIKKKTDKNGLRMLTRDEQRFPTPEIRKLQYENKISPIQYDYNIWALPYWMQEFNYAQRQLQREWDSYMQPNKIKPDKLENYIGKLKQKIEHTQLQIADAGSEERIKYMAEQIREERRASNYKVKSVMEVVEDFKKLNYLLGDKKNVEPPKPRAQPKPAVQPLAGVKKQIRSLIDLIKSQQP